MVQGLEADLRCTHSSSCGRAFKLLAFSADNIIFVAVFRGTACAN